MSEDNIFVADESHPIRLMPGAIEIAKEAIKHEGKDGDGLRVAIVGGGCSGYTYSLDFEHETRDGDVVMDCDGLKVYIDPISAGYLKGTTIDYVDNEQEAGFKFDNPNPRPHTCGCGGGCSHHCDH